MLTLVDVINKTEAFFKARGIDSARLDTELILAHVLEMDRVMLYVQYERPMTEVELQQLRPLVKRRGNREPLAWILGTREFWSLDFGVVPGVLVPRPDTETLVEAALEMIPKEGPFYIADVGTGTGAVAIALAKERPNVRVYATDTSDIGLKCAKSNVEKHELTDRVAVLRGSLLEPIPTERPLDLVVSNPPYIPSADIGALMPEVSKHEPRAALDGGSDGLDIIRALVTQAKERNASVAIELGQGQAPTVKALLSEAGFVEVGARADLAGIDRVVFGSQS